MVERPEWADRYVIVIVPGFGSHLADRVRLGTFADLIAYFDQSVPPVRYVDLQGVEGFESVKGIRHNAPVIADTLGHLGGQVLLLSHSKGGLDVLHALISDTTLCRGIDAWVAVQSPFGGSPVAEKLSGLVNPLREALDDLSPDDRATYLVNNHSLIQAVTSKISVRTCYSVYEGISSILMIDMLNGLMRRQGLETDGLVPSLSISLPGAVSVRLKDGNHADTVFPALMGQKWRSADRVRGILAEIDSALTSR